MSITVNGTLQPDWMTLHLERKVALPPGPVTVEVRPAKPASGPTMLEVLDRIHQDQRRRGQPPMTEEEMAHQIEQMRADDDDHEARWQMIWSQTRQSDAAVDNPDADLPR